MDIQAALTTVRNTAVAVVWVPKYAIRNVLQADAYIRDLQKSFFGIPVVLAAHDAGPKPKFYGGDRILVESIARVPLINLPWKTFKLN